MISSGSRSLELRDVDLLCGGVEAAFVVSAAHCNQTPAPAPTCLSLAQCLLQPVGAHVLGMALLGGLAPAPAPAPALLLAHGEGQDGHCLPPLVTVGWPRLVTEAQLQPSWISSWY